MRSAIRIAVLTASWLMLVGANRMIAGDWPQWRGPNRDAKVAGFQAPSTWPKELKKTWTVKVGDGVATPALVGDRLYTFTREGADEVIRCLEATNGKEVWKEKYAAQPATGPASAFPGPRATPAVADGKVVTLGARGTLSCLDAATGKVLWRKDDFKDSWPIFFASSSPIIMDGICIAQLGGKEKGGFTAKDNGAVVAYDLASGNEKWKWAGDSTAYSSPMVLTLNGTKALIAETDKRLVAIDIADGKLLWETPFAVPPRSRGYNAATPIVEGQTLIYTGSGRGATAVKFEKEASGLAGKELWKNKDESVIFNTPVVKDGLLYGLSQTNKIFCLNVQDGKTAWTYQAAPAPPTAPGGGGRGGPPGGGFRGPPPGAPGGGPPGGGRGGPPGGMRGGRMGRPSDGYGSIVDAGSVLIALTPRGQLTIFEPGDKEFKQVAKYKVANDQTYAYPIPADNRIYIKDADALTMWTIQ